MTTQTQRAFLSANTPEGYTIADLAFSFQRLLALETDEYRFRVAADAERTLIWARSDAHPRGVPVSVATLERRLESAIENIRHKESKELDF